MKHTVKSTVILLLLAGCGGGTTPPPAEQAAAPGGEAPESAPETPVDQMDMNEVEMQLWPPSDGANQNTRPLLSIRAQRVTGSLDGTTGELSFEGAEAVVPPQEEGDSQIDFQAARGTYQQNRKAVLSGGVAAKIDAMSITLEDITWEIQPADATDNPGLGYAFSDNPLKIDSPTQKMEAARLRLYPATQTFELDDVKGVVTFQGEQQP